MLKLNAGLSRKVGEPDYGSRGASVNLELEVEGHLIQDPDALHDRIRRLFVLARQAVDEELQVGRNSSRSPPNGNGATRATNKSPTRPATAAQLKAIRSIGERLQLDVEGECQSRFGMALDQLALPDASALIDALKARSTGAPAGRGP
ncbi:MAG TPA: hypothetical protein VJZ71_20185 [Phycisphaerae bacterium]|nr:hypothetical protein [Phycisphaerae bacterium]